MRRGRTADGEGAKARATAAALLLVTLALPATVRAARPAGFADDPDATASALPADDRALDDLDEDDGDGGDDGSDPLVDAEAGRRRGFAPRIAREPSLGAAGVAGEPSLGAAGVAGAPAPPAAAAAGSPTPAVPRDPALPPSPSPPIPLPDLSRLVAAPVHGVPSSGFGWRDDPIRHRARFHAGTDFRAPRGTPVYAAAAGVVVRAGRSHGYGRLVVVAHEDGLATRYAHLSRIEVRPGDVVDADERLGAVGSTGRATGPHLHFEVRIFGHAVDPAVAVRVGELQRTASAEAVQEAARELVPEVQSRHVSRLDPPRARSRHVPPRRRAHHRRHPVT